MSQRLLIVGGDVRPWLVSARRAGFSVCAFDFFADWDAQRMLRSVELATDETFISSIVRIDRFDDVVHCPAALSCDKAMICGGLENRTDLVRRLGQRVPILGTSADALDRLASAVEVFESLKSAGFLVPKTGSTLTDAESTGNWLRKMVRSSSGIGVRFVQDEDWHLPVSKDVFYQQKIDGDSISAVYVSSRGADGTARTWLLGISRQWVGEKALGAADFRYCGSVGPIQLPEANSSEVLRIGRFLADQYSLLGVWGIDFIVNQQGVWPVDVNPRITASAELFESGLLNSPTSLSGIVDLHVRSCEPHMDEPTGWADNFQRGLQAAGGSSVEGKGVLFHCGTSVLHVSKNLFSQLQILFDPDFFDSALPGDSIADVPCPGHVIEIGHPILTIRVRCHDENEVRRLLHQKANQIFDLLGIENRASHPTQPG